MSIATVPTDVAARPGATRQLTALHMGAKQFHGAIAYLGACGVDWIPADRVVTSDAAVDLVVASVPPLGTALRLARRLGRPLVLDLVTPWALDGRQCHPTPLHMHLERHAMRSALRGAALVLVETPELARACVDLGAEPGRVVAVPRGYDRRSAPLSPVADDAFHLLVMSELAPSVDPPCLTQNTALRRRPRQIEPAGATGYYLFSALAALQKKEPAMFGRLRLHFAVQPDRSNLDIAEWLEVESCFVAERSPVRAADAVFVCQQGEEAGARALDMSPALFAALATGRPLLAALPEGDGRDLVQHLSAGVLVPAADAPPQCRAIEAMINDKRAGTLCAGVRRAELAAFDRDVLARKLVRLLTAVVDDCEPGAGTQSLWPEPFATGAQAQLVAQ